MRPLVHPQPRQLLRQRLSSQVLLVLRKFHLQQMSALLLGLSPTGVRLYRRGLRKDLTTSACLLQRVRTLRRLTAIPRPGHQLGDVELLPVIQGLRRR